MNRSVGHNGAGKTTMMSIMTGMYLPTRGTVAINGYDIVKQTSQARESMGLCPQFDILFPSLTVREHLHFFLKLKGETDKAVIKREIDTFLKDVELAGKGHTRAGNLSGGQKRALSVAIAFIGGSKVVILDEPTSGMDPQKRRKTWELITKHKQGRTILFTTHFMDEADLLGDKVAIMTAGSLSTVGTPRFLKARFGIGYHLSIAKAANFDLVATRQSIETSVPDAKLQSNVGSELSYLLPRESAPQFGTLFRNLEDTHTALGVESFGCSSTTMEEVFLKVGEMIHGDGQGDAGADEAEDETRVMITPTGAAGSEAFRDSTPSARITGVAAWLNKFRALFYKRYVHFTRNWKTFLLLFLMPCLFVLIALATTKYASKPVAAAPGCREFGVGTNNKAMITGMDEGEVWVNGMNLTTNSHASEVSKSLFARTKAYMSTKAIVTEPAEKNMTAAILAAARADGGFSRSRFYEQVGVSASFNPNNVYVRFRQTDPGGDLSQGVAEYTTSTSGGATTCADGLCELAGWKAFPSPFVLSADSQYRFAMVASTNNRGRGALETVDTPGSTGLWVDEGADLEMGRETLATDSRMLLTETSAAGDRLPNATSGLCKTLDSVGSNICTAVLGIGQMLTVYPSDGLPSGYIRRTYLLDPSKLDRTKAYGLYLNQRQTTPIQVTFASSSAPSPAATKLSPGSIVSAWYSTQAFHFSAGSVNTASNGILREHLGKDDVGIRARNCPFAKTVDEIVDDTKGGGDALGLSINLAWGMAFLGASFILFPVFERQTEAKHVQFVSGADEYSYWLSAFAWDCVNMVLPVILITILFAAFDLDQFQGEQLGNVIALLVIGFPALVPIHYVLSFRFDSPSSAFTTCLLIFMVSSTIFLLVSSILRIPAFPQSTRDVGDALHVIFMILCPHYAVADGLKTLYTNHDNLKTCVGQEDTCKANGLEFDEDYFAWGNAGVGKHFFFLFFFGWVFWMAVLLGIEKKKKISGGCCGDLRVHPVDNEDTDVAAERQRVEGSNTSGADILTVKNLSKQYRGVCTSSSPVVVRDLSFGLAKGECFGLLGVNGAGKTSTFRMLTKATNMSAGQISVNGKDVRSNFGEVRRDLGYCPQYNGFVDSMTGREMLHMFASLRSLPRTCIDEVVQELIEQLDLTKHADRYAGTYSGGNKRKLSTALALIGNPSLIFLDEPTSGMDPAARRFLWNVLASVTKAGKSIVLTSHSMEECEVLCQRIAIMKAGSFRCIGSTQHLKSRFGREYTLIIKVSADVTKANAAKQAINQNIMGSKMVSDQNLEVTYKVPESHKLSDLFSHLANWKETFDLQDYSLSQTSLEQIFIQFAAADN